MNELSASDTQDRESFLLGRIAELERRLAEAQTEIGKLTAQIEELQRVG